MEPGQDRRYNDRDVRDNPGYLEHVLDYLEGYTGEFDFLVDMKMRAAAEYDLTTGMVRGVLNCMRNDPRVKTLPAPTGDDFEEENVIPMRRKAKREPAPETPLCPLMGTEHGIHWYGYEGADVKPGSQWRCLGWHALTRGVTRTSARFHGDYLRGPASNVIHRSTHEGEIVWHPGRPHQEGGAYFLTWTVRPTCYTPPLTRPETLTAAQVRAARPRDTATLADQPVRLCRRCFPGTDGDDPTGP